MEAADGGQLRPKTGRALGRGRRRAGHLDRQDVAQGRVLVSMRAKLLPGNHQKPAAALLDKAGQVLQVFLA